MDGQPFPIDAMETQIVQGLVTGRSIGPALDRLNMRAAKLDLADRLGELRSGDGQPLPNDADSARSWRDERGRGVLDAVRGAMYDWVSDLAENDSKFRFALGVDGLANLVSRTTSDSEETP